MSWPGASCTTTASRPVSEWTRSAVNADTATTASARRNAARTRMRSPTTRCRGNVRGTSKTAMSWTVETVGPGLRRGRSTSRPWVSSAGPNPRAPARARRTPRDSGETNGVSPRGSTTRPDGRTATTISASTTSVRLRRSSLM